MAAPTATQSKEPNIVIDIEGTNSDVATHTYSIEKAGGALDDGISVHTGTLTDWDVKILVSNADDLNSYDVTNEFFGVATLASDTVYQIAIPLSVKKLDITVTPTNAVNAGRVVVFSTKG